LIHRALTAAGVAAALLALASPAVSKPAGHGSQPRASASAAAPAAPTSSSDEEPAPSSSADGKEVHFHWKGGPQSIDLGHDIALSLPERHAFLGGEEAGQLMEKMGSFHNTNLLGVVVGKSEDANWFVTIRYDDEGYVKDTDSIDAAELLNAIKEGTEEGNKEREERGFKPFHVTGWSQPPQYEKRVHHLVWALTVRGDDGESVNFNTRVLGRHGIVSLNLVCDPAALAANKPEVATLLEGTAFKTGARYEDFNAKTDKIAEYGLAGIILGGVGLGAAKLVKIGLIAKFWKVIIAALIAGKKAIILLIAGAAAFVKRIFGRKPKATPEAPPVPPAG
jgi:uncharacterized membrane-anchored protein